MKLQNKVVLVTAATRGIGLACVQACAEEGAQVYLAGRDREEAEQKAHELREQGLPVQSVYNDATQPDTFHSMVEHVISDTGRIDVLVNNFGTSDPKKDLDFSHTDPDVFLNTVQMNLRSVFLGSQAAVKHMTERGGGCILNISSIGSIVADISQVAYGTSKAAINHLTRLIAVQEAAHNIRCNAILPGMTATDAVKKHLSEDFKKLFLRHIPLNRMALPQEIAAAVTFLASDDASYITGQTLALSGGFGLATPVYGDLIQSILRR